ncbi:HTTM domain-containing protein [Limibacter armeniacum]|uniref:HTTM domain-containing protein n=1 Tax=Limibacter armeniacum TaxID=466084 RepID=UPI002FE6A37B
MKDLLFKRVSIAPLITFRVIFGGMMLGSVIRFWLKGWIEELYLQPQFHFTYYGFEWVKPLGEYGMYLLFLSMAVAAFFIMVGFLYHYAAFVFFLAFTYVELIDLTTYLNHYYFVSLVSLLMIFVPANKAYSVDAMLKPKNRAKRIPFWAIGAIRLQLAIVYFYAGIAKLHPDWLLEAQPLRIWLAAHTDMPYIGFLFKYTWVAYFFSWFGAIYDLTIPFFLINRKTRPFAYLAVIAFHVMTAMLFPIGMFPYIMILSTLIFFSADFHEKIWGNVKFAAAKNPLENTDNIANIVMTLLLAVFFTFQLIFPFRYALYPGNLFWTEQGFRFSWRVMLMEKAGHITFYVENPENGNRVEIVNSDYLTPLQEKMMATQPDMILQFAHHLTAIYQEKGIEKPKVYAKCYVTLNGRPSKPFIDPTVNLAEEYDSFANKGWILPMEAE